MMFLTSCLYVLQLFFKFLSSLPSSFKVISGMEFYWMRDGPVGSKETEKNAICRFSHRAAWRLIPIERGASECLLQRHRFLRKLQDISRFALIISSFFPSRMWPPDIFLFSFTLFSTLNFARKHTLDFGFAICILWRGRLHLFRLTEDYPEPCFIS